MSKIITRRDFMGKIVSAGGAIAALPAVPALLDLIRPQVVLGAPGESERLTLTVAQLYNPVDMSPWGNHTTTELDIWSHFIEPLTMVDRKGKLVNIVVENSAMVSPTEWIVRIRKGLRLHDPKYGELTSEDVKYSIDRGNRPNEPLRANLPKAIQDGEVEIIDRYTIRWKLASRGLGTLPRWMATIFVTSKAYVEEVGTAFKSRPIGTGPYKFVEWATNQRIVGELFEDYWGPKPVFRRIEWRIIPDPLTAKNALLAGGIDVYQFVPPEWIPEIRGSNTARIVDTLSARMLFMVINASEPPLDNKLVRQALNHAISRKAIVEALYRGEATELRAPMQQLVPEYNKKLTGFPYDPDRARQLLKEGGYKGERVQLGAPIGRYTLDKELGEAVAGMLERVGVNVDYRPQIWSTYAPLVLSGKAHGINLIGLGNTLLLAEYVFNVWLLPGSQGDLYTRGRPNNWARDVEQASLLPEGSRQRFQLFDKLQAEVLDWSPWILLINLKDVYALSRRTDWQPYATEIRDFRDAKVNR